MSMRKILALLLAVAMICSLFVSPALAVEDAGEPVAISDNPGPLFTDIDGHWAESAINRWADYGIIQGDGDGTVRPNRTLKRDELATILSRLLGLKEKAPADTFKDVPADAWYADAVLKCAAAGIMLGDGAGRANPESPIDRQQTIVMVARALGAKESNSKSLSVFKDGDTVADWAAPYLAALTDKGILNGLPDGDGVVVAPEDNINRAGLFTLLDKAIAHYVTTPTTVTANDPNKFVVINTNAGEDVTVTGATAGIIVGAGSTDDVILDNATVGTLKVDAPVNVIIKRGSAVTDLDANAAAKVENNGTVTNLNTNADDVIFDGNKPAAVNTAKDVEPAKDSKGVEVTPPVASTGGTTSSTPAAKSADVVAAPIADHADDAIDDKDLGTVTVKGTQSGTKDGAPLYKVTITGNNIMNHTNANDRDGHWVGFGMPAKVNAEGETGAYTYTVNGTENGDIATRTCEEKGKTYNTAYFSAGTEEEFNTADPVVITVKDGDELVATYEVTFKVTFWSAKNVKVVATGTDAETAIAALQAGGTPWAHKFAEGLGLTATVKGTTVTLTEITTLEKLQNTSTGLTNADGYLTYVLQVTDDVIAGFKVGDEEAEPDVVGLPGTTLVVNQKFYQGGDKEFIANEVTFDLVDAAGRVQDSVTVTVDGTQVAIEGMNKVTFKDGDKVLKTFVDEKDAEVTAPTFTNTDDASVYYTNAWLDGTDAVVAAPFTVGEEDATYTAQKFDVVATTVSVRGNGPEGSHEDLDPVEDFMYSKVYGEAGLSMKDGKITVDATALIDMVKSTDPATANNLAHIKGNDDLADSVVFGVAYETPNTEAKQVGFATTLTGLDSVPTEKYRVLATHPSCYNNTLISYIPVATIDPATNEVTFPKEYEDGVADSDFCKWMDAEGNVVAVTKTVIEIEIGNIPTPTYTVTFQNGDEVVKTEEVEEGETVAAPEEILVAEGKGFLGWYVGAEKYDATAPIEADTVVTAKWTETIPTTPGVVAAPNAIVTALGITAEEADGVITITIPADVKAKFDALTEAQKGQLNHEDRLFVRVNSNVPAGANGDWFFQGSTDNGLTWRAKVAVTKEALGSKGINVTEADGAITAIGQWFSFATVDNASGDNFGLITPAGDWTVIYRWTNADGEMQYTTFEVKFVHATAEDDNA